MAGLGERKKKPYKVLQRKESEDEIEHDTYVLRNLSPSTDFSHIRGDLEEKGYRVISIRNAKNHATGSFSPVFFVKLFKSPINRTILELKYVAQQVIKVENYLQGPDLPRCTTCQGLDHTRVHCNNSVVCAYCSHSHHTCTCKNAKIAPPTCSRCGEGHPSNYKGCKVYRKMALLKALSDKSKEIGSQAISFSSRVTVLEKSITFTNDSIPAVEHSIASANSVTSPSVSVTYARSPITSSCRITCASREVNAVRNTTINPVKKQIISVKKSITSRRWTVSANNWTTSANDSSSNSTTYASRSVTSANSSSGSSHSWISSVSSWTTTAYDSIASPSSSITCARRSRAHASSSITSSNSLNDSSDSWIPSVSSWTTPAYDSIASLSSSVTHARSSSTYGSSSKTSNCLIDPSHILTTSTSSSVQRWPSMKIAKPLNVSQPSEFPRPTMSNFDKNDFLKEWPRIVSDVNDYLGTTPAYDSITYSSSSITHARSSSTYGSSSKTSNCLIDPSHIWTTSTSSSVQRWPFMKSAKPLNVSQPSEFPRPTMSNFDKNDFLKEWPRIVSDVNDYLGTTPAYESITSPSSSITHARSSNTYGSSSKTSNSLIGPSHIRTTSASSSVQGWPSVTSAKPLNVSQPSEFSRPTMSNFDKNDFLKEWPRIVSDVNDYFGTTPTYSSIISPGSSIPHARSSSTHASSSIPSTHGSMISDNNRILTASDWTTPAYDSLISPGDSITYASISSACASISSASASSSIDSSHSQNPSASNLTTPAYDFIISPGNMISHLHPWISTCVKNSLTARRAMISLNNRIISALKSSTSAYESATSQGDSIAYARSSITSGNSPIDSYHIWTTSAGNSTQWRPSVTSARPVNVPHPSEFSRPLPPNFYENAFKEQLRIVTDVNDHFGSMNEDLYKKLLHD